MVSLSSSFDEFGGIVADYMIKTSNNVKVMGELRVQVCSWRR